ncbi:MAG: hypothetical protein P9M03_07615 [Candidatus Theseobacter exili]|nr:hypothetical protein [Candidatus Theseobacter exili]
MPADAYTAVNFLAASSMGNIARTITLNYEDGSQEKRYLGTTIGDMNFKSYTGKIGWFGKPDPDSVEIDLLHVTVPVSPSKTLKSIVLPNEPLLRVYAVTLTQGGIAENVNVTVILGDKEISGQTDWAVSVRDFDDTRLDSKSPKVIAMFRNGRPAIMMSRDGKHVSFLYDALGWSDNKNEISVNVDAHSKLLHGLLNNYLKQSEDK